MRRAAGRTVAAGVAGATLITACSSSDSSRSADTTTGSIKGGPGRSVRAYETFDSCDSLLSYLKARALEMVGPYGLGGGRIGLDDRVFGGVASTAAAGTVAAPAASAREGDNAAKDTSGTNVQVEGVDEGDVVDTDGRRVWSVVDNALRTVDLDTGKLLSSITLGSGWTSPQLMLDKDRLVVMSAEMSTSGDASTVVAVYDVAGEAPRELSREHLEGALVASRAVDGKARLVLSTPGGARLPFVMPEDGNDRESSALNANKAVINNSKIDDWLPRRYSDSARSSIAPSVACSAVGRPAEFSGLGFTWVATLDMHASVPATKGAAAVVADSQQVYASSARLYVTTTRYGTPSQNGLTPVRPQAPTTAIHAFDISAANGAKYLASGQVDGTLLNQYSMDERNDVLRIATTTTASGFGKSAESQVRTLRINGESIDQIGEVGGLGATERIYAVRFLGDRAYVVTFRQTDPLYVVDLTKPESPALLGELKIPGFSNYLHPIGDGLIVGFGQSATTTGRATGAQAAVFDVNDPAHPKQLATIALGQTSLAQYDPHAFLWWPETRQLFLPTMSNAVFSTVPAGPGSPQMMYPSGRVSVVSVGKDGSLKLDATLEQPSSVGRASTVARTLIAKSRIVTVSTNGVMITDPATYKQAAWVEFK